jgi:hypothetical protein
LIKNRLRTRNNWGVSEIISNLLVLSITVVLFSGIAMYVGSMPSPANLPAVEFRLDVEKTNETSLLHIVKKGGDVLHPWSTKIVMIAGDRSEVHELGHGGVVADWDTGEAWISSLPAGAKETRVLIYETEKGNVIWDGKVSSDGAEDSIPPFFSVKGFGITPAKAGQANTICAKIVDPSQRLDRNTVRLDGTQIGLGASLVMTDENLDGVYETGTLTPSLDWSGKVCNVTAQDVNGATISDRISLEVSASSEAASPPGNLYRNGDHLVGLFEATDWLARGFAATPKEDFPSSATATLVFASRSLMDPSDMNSVRILSANDGKEVRADCLSQGMSPAGFIDGYYIYTCTFAISDAIDSAGSYDLVALLKDTSSSPVQASFSLPLTVDGSVRPRLEIARGESQQTTSWVLAGDTMLLDVKFSPRMHPRSPKAELVIQDLDGNIYLRCDPFTSSYCDFVFQDELGTKLLVDLSSGACKAWRAGNNTYIVLLDGMKGSYGQVDLCRPVKISATPYAVDLLLGGDPLVEHTPQGVAVLTMLQGAGRLQVPLHLKTSSLTDDRAYQDGVLADLDGDGIVDAASIMCDYEKVRYLDNHYLLVCLSGNGYQPRVLDSLGSSSLSSNYKEAPRPSVEAADLDGDGDLDLAVQVGRVISVFWNDGSWTREKAFTLPATRIPVEMRALALGDLDGDGASEHGLAVAHDKGITTICLEGGKWTDRVWQPDLSGYPIKDICVKPGAYQGMDLVLAITDWEVFAGYYRHDVPAGLVMPCPAYEFPSRVDAREIDAGDMDGDGKLEIITLSVNTDVSVLTILDDNADGYLAAASITSDAATRLTALEIADVQEDGRAELMVGGIDGRVQMLSGNGPASLWFNAGNMHLLQATSCAIRFLWAA